MAMERARTRRLVTLQNSYNFTVLTSRLYPQDIKDIKPPTTTSLLLNLLPDPILMTASRLDPRLRQIKVTQKERTKYQTFLWYVVF
jgi:hypothetical protein